MHADARLFNRARRTQAGPRCPDGNLNAIASVQRGPYRGDVAHHRAQRADELLGDLGIGEAEGDRRALAGPRTVVRIAERPKMYVMSTALDKSPAAKAVWPDG